MKNYHITKDLNKTEEAKISNRRHIVLPLRALNAATSMPITKGLFLSSTGHYPHATGHYVERKTPVDEWILIYCTDGKGWCTINDKTFNMSADTAVLIPNGIPHAYAANESYPWTIYWIHIIGEHIEDYANALDFTIEQPVIYLKHSGQLIHHFEEFFDILKYGYAPRTLLSLSTSLAYFFGELNMQRCQREQQGLDLEESINASIEFMHQNISSSLTLKELAEYTRLSASHYSATFHELKGISPIRFFSEIKIQRAVELLHEPNLKIKDIAAMIGINDPYYFSRFFKKSTGYSPAVYRKKNAHRNYPSVSNEQ